MRALFARLRRHNLKLSPSKARLGATDAEYFSHSILPVGVRPNADKISTLPKMPMTRDLKQVRALPGGVGYYRKFLRDLSKRIRPITSLLQKGAKLEFTPAMEVIVREILAELGAPPILVFPDWDAVVDGSRPFHVYSDACIDGFGAALEQEQPDGSVRPIAYISCATRGTGPRLTWKLAALSGPSNAFEATYGARTFASSRITRRSKALAKWGITMHLSLIHI